MAERLIRPAEAATILGISKPTLYRWLNDGRLPALRRVGDNVVGILESELTEFLRSRPVTERRRIAVKTETGAGTA